MRIPANAAIAASALAVTVLAGGGPVGAAAHSPGWRIVTTVGATSHNELPESLTATGPKDAFSAWTCADCSRSNRNLDFVLHWDGRHWKSIGLPLALTYPSFVTSVSASSASNLWAVTDQGRVGIWNGRRWTVKTPPAWVLRPTREGDPNGQAAVSAPGNAWIFSLDAVSEPTLAAHFGRGAWRKVWLPVAPYAVSQVSSRDIWAVGFTRKSLTTSKPVEAVAHWNGSSWRALALPKVSVPSGTDAGYGLAAVGPRDIWLTRQVATSGHSAGVALLHWTGRWRVIKLPSGTDSLPARVSQPGRPRRGLDAGVRLLRSPIPVPLRQRPLGQAARSGQGRPAGVRQDPDLDSGHPLAVGNRESRQGQQQHRSHPQGRPLRTGRTRRSQLPVSQNVSALPAMC